MSGSEDPGNTGRNSFALTAKVMIAIICMITTFLLSTALTGGTAEYKQAYESHLTNESIVLEIPYYNQGDTNWCLYYCLAMMYNYNNCSVEPWEIADYFDSAHNETFSEQYDPYNSMLSDYTKETCDLDVRKTIWGYNIGSFDNETFNTMIMENIDRGQPVLMAFQYEIDERAKEGHAIIAVGYDSEYIYLTDPSGAITSGLFDYHEGYIAVPVSWDDFNEKLVSRIKPSNMAFTIEVLNDAPATTSQGSLYLTDRSNNKYSSLSFTNRSNYNDTALLRFDGSCENGYTIIKTDNLSSERPVTSMDCMSVYFSISNPTESAKNYIVKTNIINNKTDAIVDNFFFEINTEVPAFGSSSKGINYFNQLSSLNPGDYILELTLTDEDNNILDSVSINIPVT